MIIWSEHIRAVIETIEGYNPPFTSQKIKSWHRVNLCPICRVARKSETGSCEDCLFHELVRRGMLETDLPPHINRKGLPICQNIKDAPPMPHPCIPLQEAHMWNVFESTVQAVDKAKKRALWLASTILPKLMQAMNNDVESWFSHNSPILDEIWEKHRERFETEKKNKDRKEKKE